MLGGGEDYALLFTANTNLHADLEALGAHAIGQCDKGDTVRLYQYGESIDYQIKGYDHFG
jgi:thiamine monophosphate kinase